MIKASLLSLAGVFLLASAAAAAPNAPSVDMPAAQPAAAQTPAKSVQTARNTDDSDRVICKSEETTGTRLGGHRTCMTKAAWADQARAAADSTSSIEMNGDHGSLNGH